MFNHIDYPRTVLTGNPTAKDHYDLINEFGVFTKFGTTTFEFKNSQVYISTVYEESVFTNKYYFFSLYNAEKDEFVKLIMKHKNVIIRT